MQKRRFHILFMIVAFICVHNICPAQQLDNISKKDVLKVSGGLNLNSIYLNTNNPYSTRDPFTWYLSGNINFSILNWSIPFTYTYSNNKGTYTQPFNQYGLTPTYKWIKTYVGWSNMSFSSYTLSGKPFLGGGAELTPKNWKMAFFYGRMNKAVEYDALTENATGMAYKQMGMGAKIGFEKKGYGLSFIWFDGRDVANSLSFVPPTANIKPQANTVVSVQGKMPVTKYFTIESEYALSGLTTNTQQDAALTATSKNKLPLIFKPNGTSEFFSAFKSAVNFTSKFVGLGFNYERVAPGYKTLGAYYFNNDFENITLTPQFRLFKNKLTVAMNAGMQKNNLNDNKITTTRRAVGSANINIIPNKKWMIAAAYSNFTSFTRNRPITDPYYVPSPADTMRFYQVSQNGNLNINHNFEKKNFRNSITLIGLYQVSSQQTGSISQEPVTVLSGNTAYALIHKASKTNVSVTFNANQSTMDKNITTLFGPGLSIGKSFFKNSMNTSLGATYNNALLNGSSNGSVIAERLNINFSPKVKNSKYGKPTFGLSCSYVTRNSKLMSQKEFTGTINLGYNF